MLTGTATYFDLGVPTVGDLGELPTTLPWVALPQIPFTLETLQIVLPYAVTLAFIGLLESLLTAQILDDMTDTGSDKNQECRGQGVANVATGFLGGMAGCAMIGQSMINIKSGGRTRRSTFSAGFFLLVLILVFGDLIASIPMAALVAVMFVVAVATFDWTSLHVRSLHRTPKSETAVMVVTVAIVVQTHNLAYGVVAGVLLAAIFCASTNELIHSFDYADPTPKVVIDLTDAHVWDSSAVATLDAIVNKFKARGVTAEVVGLNTHSEALHTPLTGQYAGSH